MRLVASVWRGLASEQALKVQTVAALAGALLCASSPVAAQPARPKIGVALSGGGARGLAHIGVLRWLDEHRIPIDFIAGTSAGGLVGAMYATGIAPEKMASMVGEVDWSRVLGGIQSYEELSFRRKQDRRAFQNDLELGLQGGLRAPAGLNAGHSVGLIFDQIALPYSALSDFDALPVPLRLVATDLVKGEAHMMGAGSLSLALRATMAVPGLFTPVERDGRLLVDGALTNNLPTDVVRNMGADLVVAVDISPSLAGRETLESLPGVLSQAIGIMALENERRHLQQADIVIAPDLKDTTAFSYYDAERLVELGYQGAAQKSAVLTKFAVDEATWEVLTQERAKRVKSGAFTPEYIEIESDGAAPSETERQLSAFVGRPLQPDLLEARLDEIRGQGRYESLGYERAGASGLLIRAKSKSYGPPIINFGGQIDGADVGNVRFLTGFRLTQFDIGHYGSELRTDLRFGSDSLLSTEYYRPFGDTAQRGFFLAPRAYYQVRNSNLFQNRARAAQYRTRRAAIGLDAGYLFARSEARAGIEIGNLAATLRIGSPLLPTYRGKYAMLRVRYEFDGHDSAVVPTSGTRLTAETRYFLKSPGATEAFPQADLRLSSFWPLSNRSSVFFIGAAGSSFGRTAAPAEQFTVGGPFRVGTLQSQELRGSRYLLTSAGYQREIANLPPLLGGKLYGLLFYERGSAFEARSQAEYVQSLSAALVAGTRLGPAVIGVSMGDEREPRFYFSLGHLFD